MPQSPHFVVAFFPLGLGLGLGSRVQKGVSGLYEYVAGSAGCGANEGKQTTFHFFDYRLRIRSLYRHAAVCRDGEKKINY